MLMKAEASNSTSIAPLAEVAGRRIKAAAPIAATPLRIISVREAAHRLNIGRSTLYAWLDEKSPSYKPGLPKPVHLGRSTGFIEHEIDEFIRCLMQVRGGDVGN